MDTAPWSIKSAVSGRQFKMAAYGNASRLHILLLASRHATKRHAWLENRNINGCLHKARFQYSRVVAFLLLQRYACFFKKIIGLVPFFKKSWALNLILPKQNLLLTAF